LLAHGAPFTIRTDAYILTGTVEDVRISP